MRSDPFTKTALEAAVAAGEILVKHFTGKLAVEYKGAINPVTSADKAAQKKIIRLIKARFPDHAVIGEEEGLADSAPGEYSWIVDPLDGTVNYMHRIPVFGVSIGLMHKGKMIAGVVHAPLLRETFVAAKGRGSWLNGKRIRVSTISKPVSAAVVTGFSYAIHEGGDEVVLRFGRVLRSVQAVRRLGSAALDLAYVAAGRFEAFWEEGLSPWDVAAGSLLVQEAGGKVSDFSGGEGFLFGDSILATNGAMHRKMRAMIA